MRTVKISCDRCKKEIAGYPIKVIPVYVDTHKLIKYALEMKKAEEEGLILRLPYPLGTEHIYFADEKDMDVYKLDAEKIEVHMMPISKKVMYTIDCFEFLIEDFGKIVFLTKEEAEQALAMKGGSNEV